jgi:1,4-dihydroxy-2-naphthoate polyprenyltransferase
MTLAGSARAAGKGAGVAAALRTCGAVIRLGRPLFLGGGFLLYGLGAAIAAWHGHPIDAGRYALGQAAVTALQLMTHYANEYYDYDCDRANPTPTRWSGGSRVLACDELPRGVALVAALAMGAIGCALAAVVVARGGPWAAPTLAAIAVLAWEYSAPPLRLCARGAGELDTAVVVTGLVPWLGFYLQAPDLAGGGTLAVAIVPLALLQLAMLLAIELPDATGDAATGKRTLVVRLGPRRAAVLYATATLGAYAWLPLGVVLGLPVQVALAAALPLPVALWRVARLADHRDPAAYNRLTTAAVGLLVATAAAELLAFAI